MPQLLSKAPFVGRTRKLLLSGDRDAGLEKTEVPDSPAIRCFDGWSGFRGTALDFEAKSVLPESKKRGPKPNPNSIVRLPDALIEAADLWASKQMEYITRSEAIRRLVELGLKGK